MQDQVFSMKVAPGLIAFSIGACTKLGCNALGVVNDIHSERLLSHPALPNNTSSLNAMRR